MKQLMYLMLLLLVFTGNSHAQIITTFAGNGVNGNTGDGGPATAAEINAPFAMAADDSGNIYFSTADARIKKVNTAGIITTIAGNGGLGYTGDGGPATDATFSEIFGVAVDGAGNVFIADGGNLVIRKIDVSGIVTTIAGTGLPGYSGDGGPATAATLFAPSGVAVGKTGLVYVCDQYNSVIRKINGGIISTIAGTGTGGHSGDGGPATAALLNKPFAIALDTLGNLYIADSTFYIRKVDTDGIITTIAGIAPGGFSGDGGPATSAKLAFCWGLTVDRAGNLFFSDHGNQRIRVINTENNINTWVGTGIGGYNGDNIEADTAEIFGPFGVVVGHDDKLYIADFDNSRIRVVSPPPNAIASIDNSRNLFRLYPNPASVSITVDANAPGIARLYDITCRQRAVYKLMSGSNKLSLAGIDPGMYLFMVNDEQGGSATVIRLVVQ